MRKVVDGILVLVLVFGAGAVYLYKDEAIVFTRNLILGAPCSRTLTYSLGALDPRFTITEEKALAYLKEASNAWSTVGGKELFSFTRAKGDIVVTFTYDTRQQVTDTLHTLTSSITTTDATYEALRTRIDMLKAAYENDKASFDARQAALTLQQESYNAEVVMWNKKGGAPKTVYDNLQKQGAELQSEYRALSIIASNLASEVKTLNSLIDELNSTAATHNASATEYNKTAASVSSEFREGEYVEKGTSREIHIYQFDNETKLLRVLMHEFGHALGLEHVKDPEAIMFSLNDASGKTLTEADKEELMRVCRKEALK